jgi:CBS domain-containing protein
MGQQVKEVMTPQPITLDRGASLVEAARVMRDQGIGDVIIVDGDDASGIVTDRDIVIRGVADGADPNTTRVGQVVSGDLTSVAPDDTVDRAIELMREKAVRRLPVLQGGKPVGVVSLGDLAIQRDSGSVLADISDEPDDR